MTSRLRINVLTKEASPVCLKGIINMLIVRSGRTNRLASFRGIIRSIPLGDASHPERAVFHLPPVDHDKATTALATFDSLFFLFIAITDESFSCVVILFIMVVSQLLFVTFHDICFFHFK